MGICRHYPMPARVRIPWKSGRIMEHLHPQQVLRIHENQTDEPDDHLEAFLRQRLLRIGDERNPGNLYILENKH